MKATTDRAELASAAKWVARTIGKNPNVPILSGMRVQADDRGVTLAATDYDTSVTATVDAAVFEEGSVLAGGHALASFLGAFRGQDVSMATEDNALALRSGRAVSVVQTMDLADYPNVRNAEGTSQGEISGGQLADALGALAELSYRPGAAEIGDLHWQMSASLVADGESLTIIAGTRYAFGRIIIPSALESLETLVPTATLVGVLTDLSGELSVYHDGSTFGLTSASRSVVLRTVAVQKLPKFETVLDSRPDGVAVVALDAIRGAVKVAQAAGTGRVRMDFEDGEIRVSAYKPDGGELINQISDVVDAEVNATHVAALNGGHLTSILAGLTGSEITLGYTPGDGSRPKPLKFTDGRSVQAMQPITLPTGV